MHKIPLFEEAPTYLRVGFGGFVIAALGVMLGFSGQRLNSRAIGLVGFGITVIGVGIGFVAIASGIVWLLIRAFRPRRDLDK